MGVLGGYVHIATTSVVDRIPSVQCTCITSLILYVAVYVRNSGAFLVEDLDTLEDSSKCLE